MLNRFTNTLKDCAPCTSYIRLTSSQAMHQENVSVDAVIDRFLRQEHADSVNVAGIVNMIHALFTNKPHIKDVYTLDYIEKRKTKLAGYKNVLADLLRNPGIEQRTAEWYDVRKSLITASDFAQALGEGKFGTQKQLFQKKSGYEVEKFNPMVPPLKWGTMFEAVACQIYEQRNDCKVHEFGLLRHPEHDFFGASPDGITDMGIMLEIKCPYKRKITGEIPVQYYYQIQGQLDVCKLEECDYLECEFEEYPTQEDFETDAHTVTERGAIIEYRHVNSDTPCYAYCPYIIAGHHHALENTHQKVLEWVENQLVEIGKQHSIVDVHWWKLAKLNVMRVYKNDEFVKEKLIALKEIWDKVKMYQNNKELYDQEITSTVNKRERETTTSSFINLKGYAFI
jgi:putative phage-type endonuclease